MSSHANRILIMLFMICFVGCKSKTDHVLVKTQLFSNYSKKLASDSVYERLYDSAHDSIYSWVENNLKYAQMQEFSTWRLDSLLCLNKHADKCIMAILNQESKSVSNSLNIFFGVNLKNGWCFFYGPTIYTTPYSHDEVQSFDKLHEMAMNNIFNGYLKKKDKGFWGNLFGKTEWEVDDDFFNEINVPRVPFEDRKTDPNTYFSCCHIDDKKEYEDCFFRHEALSIWNQDSAFVCQDACLYAPEFPVATKIRQVKKGEFLRVIERIDNSRWCCVSMLDSAPNLGLIENRAISK